jgi:cytoskeletal protein CcmA (bactofilin family)
MLELQPKARVSGEVHYRAIELHRGAVLEGIVSHFDGDLVRPQLRLGAGERRPADAVAPLVPAAQDAG